VSTEPSVENYIDVTTKKYVILFKNEIKMKFYKPKQNHKIKKRKRRAFSTDF